MTGQIRPVSGRECKLYYNTTLATTFTVSGAVLITEAVDVSLSQTKNMGTVASRASEYAATVPGLQVIELTFGYQYRSDPNDSVFTALRQAYLGNTILHWAVMDNILATPGPRGSQGQTFPGVISEFPIEQPLEDSQKIEVKVSVVRAYASGTLIDPAWLIIAAT
jgi:hypothetical protein